MQQVKQNDKFIYLRRRKSRIWKVHRPFQDEDRDEWDRSGIRTRSGDCLNRREGVSAKRNIYMERTKGSSHNSNWSDGLVVVDDFISSPGKGPGTVVMIQCVGSRDEERPYCSRLCCTEAVKNALKIKELSPSSNVYVLYRDIRTYGFKESYYTKARQQGVVFIRYDQDKKPVVSKEGKRLKVHVYDQTLGSPSRSLRIWSSCPQESFQRRQQNHRSIPEDPLNKDGFFLEAHMKLRPIDFARMGFSSPAWRITRKPLRRPLFRPRRPLQEQRPCFQETASNSKGIYPLWWTRTAMAAPTAWIPAPTKPSHCLNTCGRI